jgi:hypothetical protein
MFDNNAATGPFATGSHIHWWASHQCHPEGYVGTWVDSMTSYLWTYQGAVDDTGKVLTLETRGPCPQAPGKLSQFREVIEIKSADHRTFTSSMLQDDGKWTTLVNIQFWRKK